MLFCVQDGRLTYPCIRAKFFNRVCEEYVFPPLKGKKRDLPQATTYRKSADEGRMHKTRVDETLLATLSEADKVANYRRRVWAQGSHNHTYSCLVESQGDGEGPGAPG